MESAETVAQTETLKKTKITKLVMDGFKSFGKRTELLFGDQFNVILGPNGSGKCLTGDSTVALADGSMCRIDQLVNKRLEKGSLLLDDGFMAASDGTEILSLDTKTLTIEARPIKAFIKRTSPKKLMKIRTASGREITTTTYHPLFILKNGVVTSVKADELYEGVCIAVPRILPLPPKSKTFIELLDVISEKDGLYVPWSNELKQLVLKSKKGTWKETAKKIEIPLSALKGFFDKQAINFSYLIKILRYVNIPNKRIIELIPFIKAKKTGKLCKIPWENTPGLSRLLGYLLSEGRFPPKSDQLWFTNGAEEIIKDYFALLTSIFEIRATINEYKPGVWDVLSYSTPARIILQKLGMAVGGTSKRTVTNLFFMHAGIKEIAELLNSLYSGDGYISKSCIELTTKSPSLAFAVETALLRLGVIPCIKEVWKMATNTGFAGKYKLITIYGIQNFEKFAQNIKLVHPEKQSKLGLLLGKTPNPNVDLIGANNLVKDAVKKIGLNVKKLKKKFPRLDAYCYNQCIPSRFGVQHLLNEVFVSNQEASSVQKLKLLSNSDILWDKIISIEEIKSEEWWVYDLCVEEDRNFIANNIFVHNSNVLDALCFVLGKSSSKALRAEKSANLIYNGGKTKNPSKTAEVSLFFDNSQKTFPVDEDTIKVSRIVREDGLSKYKINGKTRARQEVLELLSHAKINPAGYNIILQGDIVKLVEMSPIERRQIIEEIAGISIYEEKKNQAVNELNKVEEKLKEAGIVLKERDGYLKDLKKDRDQALKHKSLSDRIKTNKATYLKKQIDRKEKSSKILKQKSADVKEKLGKIQVQVNSLREEIKVKKEEIQKISSEIEEKGEVGQLKLQKEIENLRIERATKKTKITSCSDELTRMAQRKTNIQETLKELTGKVEDLEKSKKELETERATLSKNLEELEKRIKDFKKKHKLGEDTNLEKEIEEIDKKADERQKDIHVLREKQQDLLREQDKLEYQLQTIEEKKSKVKEIEKEYKNEVDALKRKREQLRKTILELNDFLNKDSKEASELANSRQKLFSLKGDLTKLEAKKATIKEQLSFNVAVQRILSNKSKFGGIHGTVAELGTSDSKYSPALDVAAGNKIQSIVVVDDKTAAKCIKYLKDNKLGVATFIPLNKIKPSEVKPEIKELAKTKGVHGMAIDLISFEPQYKDVFSYVFGNTLVVNNIETARKVGVGKVKMVTLDGDISELSGAMIGGYRHKKTGSFKEKGAIEKIDELEEEVKDSEKKCSHLEKAREENEAKISGLREERANLEGDIIKTEKSLHLAPTDLEADRSSEKEILAKKEEISKDMQKLDNEVSGLTRELTNLKIEKQKLRAKITELRNPRLLAELNTYEEKRREFSEDLIKVNAELKNYETQLSENFVKDKENAAKVLKEMEREEIQFQNEKKELEKDVKQGHKKLKVKEEEQKKFYSQFKALFERRNKTGDEINFKENKILNLEEGSRKQELELNTISIEMARFDAELASLNAEFENHGGVELDMNKTEEILKKEIAESERLMVLIGVVNMRALEIYETAEKEYSRLLEKKESLETEKGDVLRLMEEIETSKKGLFLKTLEVVDKHFRDVFTSLSTKGEAFLELENNENLFEAGLRIKVKLTGTKFLDIRSLSGGEKTLTALAFLFAIQEHEPASFYVLDEVDAALDKQNSEKLAKLVRSYCKNAQYVVITHNDAVISEADILYGVSMAQDVGISKVVSLKV